MKKILSVALVLVLALGLVACGGEKVTPYEGDLSQVIATLYETCSPELMVSEAMPVDLTDAFAVEKTLGLTADSVTGGNAEGLAIKEAFYSEPFIGSQAYSLVIARTAEGADVQAVKKAMFDGIDTAKWICVCANELRVVSSGDVIMLVMVNSELGATLADDMVEAFKGAVGELSGETLSKSEAI